MNPVNSWERSFFPLETGVPFISSRSAVCKPAHDQKDPEILLVTPGLDWLDLLGFFFLIIIYSCKDREERSRIAEKLNLNFVMSGDS